MKCQNLFSGKNGKKKIKEKKKKEILVTSSDKFFSQPAKH